jgi:hypothetical protein
MTSLSYTVILKIHIQESKYVFQIFHSCVPETVLWQVEVVHTVCVCACTIR